ncbi:MAG TPA: sigma-70 family RNA polymerase sigma factor [Candidatus Polarisedimenticolia bacterium]|nr:sigma-70 family RNA polymerase sigma factor [Candidatus Polarisedimenticolia bacterium]
MDEQEPPAKSREIELFLAGDPATVASVRKIAESVVSHKKYGIPRSDRPDIVQQTLADLCRAARKPGYIVKTLPCLVAYMAHCRCVDWLRKLQPMEVIPAGVVDPGPGPDKQILLTDDAILTTKIMERLPPACRWLMEMVIGLDIPYADVAGMTGRSEGALRVQMWSCIRKARKIHQSLDGGPPRGTPSKDGNRS